MSQKKRKARAPSSITPSPSDEKQEALAQKPEEPKRPELRDMPHPGWLLSLTLSTAVPIEIDHLYQNFRSQAGILPWMVGEAVLFGQVLAERGDKLLFKSERKGETADMFVGLARALAIMSFAPGGVPFLEEESFDAMKQLSSWYGDEEAQTFCQKALRPYFDAVINEIPVTCWREGSEAVVFGTYNALHWFQQAENEDVLRLRAEHFQGRAAWVLDLSSRTGYEQSLLSQMFEQAQSRMRWSVSSAQEEQSIERLGDQLLLAARDGGQEIAFQVETKAASAWLVLYKHALLTGEHWLLPPEPKQRKKRSSDHL